MKGWFTVLNSIEADQQSWWREIAPDIAFPLAFAGSQLDSTSPLEISEEVDGSTPNSITLNCGEDSRTFALTGTFSGSLVSITQFSIK